MENNFKMVAKTLFGFEELLAKELTQLGAQARVDDAYGDRNLICTCAPIEAYVEV